MRRTLAICALALLACSVSWTDGLDTAKLPENVRDDYGVFAQRCSKCHALARPLGSGIDDDAYWFRYVERMRRMPSSGISLQDETPILRFLHYYSEDQKRSKAARQASFDGGAR